MLFGFNVVFNNLSVISIRCLVATGSSMLTFIVLPHCGFGMSRPGIKAGTSRSRSENSTYSATEAGNVGR